MSKLWERSTKTNWELTCKKMVLKKHKHRTSLKNPQKSKGVHKFLRWLNKSYRLCLTCNHKLRYWMTNKSGNCTKKCVPLQKGLSRIRSMVHTQIMVQQKPWSKSGSSLSIKCPIWHTKWILFRIGIWLKFIMISLKKTMRRENARRQLEIILIWNRSNFQDILSLHLRDHPLKPTIRWENSQKMKIQWRQPWRMVTILTVSSTVTRIPKAAIQKLLKILNHQDFQPVSHMMWLLSTTISESQPCHWTHKDCQKQSL